MGSPDPPPAAAPVVMRALVLGQRIDLRAFSRAPAGAADPVPFEAPGVMAAFGLRWGAVVLAGAEPGAEAAALASLRPRIVMPLAAPVEEAASIVIRDGPDGIDADGLIHLAAYDAPRLALVADALAKSAALSQQEATLAETLDGMEPVVARLKRLGRLGVTSRPLLRAVGSALEARSRATARVDVEGKPDILWDNPGLERLHARLVDEFELRDRAAVLDRKLVLIGETVQSLLAIIEARRTLGLEVAIATLIGIEVVATLYDVAFK
jgi:uncharacterized Rmd1/YagE family protein